MRRIQKILLFGPPGAGKDTQADLLASRLGVKKLSMGDILRNETTSRSDLGTEIAPYLERGEIVPKGIGTQLMRRWMLDVETQRLGYVVTSFPRTMGSFQNYLTFDQPTLLVVLTVLDEVVLKRLVARRRYDDHENVIHTRLRLYHQLDEATIAWVKANTHIPVVTIDGTLPIEQVQEEIFKAVNSSHGSGLIH